jgi:hypothetical protein
MRILYEIELFKIVGRNIIKSTGLWHICYLFAGLKILGRLPYMGGAAEFLLKKMKLLIFFVNLYRCLKENQLLVVSAGSLLVLLVVIMTTTSP